MHKLKHPEILGSRIKDRRLLEEYHQAKDRKLTVCNARICEIVKAVCYDLFCSMFYGL